MKCSGQLNDPQDVCLSFCMSICLSVWRSTCQSKVSDNFELKKKNKDINRNLLRKLESYVFPADELEAAIFVYNFTANHTH